MNSRKPEAKNIFILLVEEKESVSILIERCFHESSRLTDIVTHLLHGEETTWDANYLIDELLRKSYDCVLMDVSLPSGNNGITLSEAVAVRIEQPPPIILLAANISPALRARAMSAGAQDILDKNDLTPDSLRRVIDVAVNQKRNSAAAS